MDHWRDVLEEVVVSIENPSFCLQAGWLLTGTSRR
jgi:hypothetical protein